MILRTLLYTLTIFVGYNIFLILKPLRWWKATQSQAQSNIVRAQNYIYHDKGSLKNVLVGSSLSFRIRNELLPDSYNLSFAGLSVFDGLKILEKERHAPERVFIEMNVILRPENETFVKSLYSPVLYHARNIFPALKEDKQPIAVLGKTLYNGLNSKFGDRQIEKSQHERGSLMMNVQKNAYSKPAPSSTIQERLSQLKSYVIMLEERGCTVVFYEMPVHKSLKDLPHAKSVRESFYLHFDSTRYQYVPDLTGIEFLTSDGVHLTKAEAETYSLYLRRYLTTSNNSKSTIKDL